MHLRSLGTRLFVAIAAVSAVAFVLGVWLMDRALRIEVRESVTISRSLDGPPRTDTRREVTEAPGPRIGGGPVRRRVLLALALVVAGAALCTAWLVRRIVRPVGALREATDRIAQGDRTARVGVTAGDRGRTARGGDELNALAHAFNHMADRLDTVDRQRRDLTNDVAHELRTPLTNLRCHLEALAEGVAPFSTDGARALLDDVGHLQRIVDDLADLAGADAGQLAVSVAAVALAPVVAALARELRPRLEAAAVTLKVDDLASLPLLRADPARLAQVLRNLLDNAVTHTPRGGAIRVAAEAAPPDIVRIVVSDSGPGIPTEHLERVFDRFHRTDPSRSRATGGAGLGLAIVRQLVALHGGRVHAASPAGTGAALTVEWPVFIESSQPARLIDA